MPSWCDTSDQPDTAPGPGIIFQWRRIPDIAAITSLVINTKLRWQNQCSHTTITETTDIIPSVRKWESPPWPVSAISVCYDSEPVPMFRPSPAPRPMPASDTERVTVSRYWRVERDRECYMLHVTQWVLARIIVNVSWLQFHFITSRVQLTFLSPPPTMAHWVKIVLNNCDRSETSWHLQLFGEFYQCRPSGH